jgi:hypothetical protein
MVFIDAKKRFTPTAKHDKALTRHVSALTWLEIKLNTPIIGLHTNLFLIR